MDIPKQNIIQRMNIIEGQVLALQKMLLKETYFINIIIQTSAIKQAITNIEDFLLEDYLSNHVIHDIHNGNEKIAIENIIKIYKLKRK